MYTLDSATSSHDATLSRGSDSSPPFDTQANKWYWQGDSKRTCTTAVRNSGPDFGATKCCYGWIDIAFFPRHVHVAFGRGVVAFWEADYIRTTLASPASSRLDEIR